VGGEFSSRALTTRGSDSRSWGHLPERGRAQSNEIRHLDGRFDSRRLHHFINNVKCVRTGLPGPENPHPQLRDPANPIRCTRLVRERDKASLVPPQGLYLARHLLVPEPSSRGEIEAIVSIRMY
jgi:hypothetical protein